MQLNLGFNITNGTINWRIVKEYVTPTWYGYLMEFLLTFNGYQKDIEIIEDISLIPLLHEKNSFIIVAFINVKYQKGNLDILNEIQKSIKAFSLKVITNSRGYRITLDAWNLTQSNKICNHYDWPRLPQAFTTHHKCIIQSFY